MIWLAGVLLIIAIVAMVVLFLQRFYVKASRDSALVRTGAGGRKVVIDAGALALPILHRVDRVNMRAVRLAVGRRGETALISGDRLRVDIVMEFVVRVAPSLEGIATAAQALGAMAYQEDQIQALIEGKLIDAIQAEVAGRSMDALHEDRSGLSQAIGTRLADTLARFGLGLESASLIHLDQTPFAALDDNNAFDAVGMRRLAEMISENRRARIELEAETDIIIRRRQLAQAMDQIAIERQREEAEIGKRQEIEQRRIRAEADIAMARTQSSGAEEEARISRDNEVKRAEIERDLSLRKRELEALSEVEAKKIENAIHIAAKRGEETVEQAKTEAARAKIVEAQEAVQTAKDLAAAERARKLAAIKAGQEAEVDETKVKAQVSSMLSIAKAEAQSVGLKGDAERDRLVAEAEGRRAQIDAENAQSPAVLRSRLEMHKLDRLPEITAQMMKPVEKIESIRINQIAGLGQNGHATGAAEASPFNQALDSILGMSVQLPMMKRIGEEIGLDFDAQLAGRTADAAGRATAARTATRNKTEG